jgi:hypothetical protein
MQGKYFIFFLSNCANLNSLRTFNDDATPIPLYLIADFCLCFLKSIVLYVQQLSSVRPSSTEMYPGTKIPVIHF